MMMMMMLPPQGGGSYSSSLLPLCTRDGPETLFESFHHSDISDPCYAVVCAQDACVCGSWQGDDGRAAVPADTPPVFGNTGKVPPQMTAIAHNIRRSGGRPRMLLLPLGELSLYPNFFSDRIYEVSGAMPWLAPEG